MYLSVPRLLAFVATLTAATVAFAQTKGSREAADARLKMMELHAFNLAIIGNMARGRAPFDADTASAAARRLADLAAADWTAYFPPGTSADDFDTSRVEPAVWENWDDFSARHDLLKDVTARLAATEMTDATVLRESLVELTEACGGCHREYRRIPN